MDNEANKYSKHVTITNELGIHARSAAQIAQIAKDAKSKVWVVKDGEKADAGSIIDILTLACAKGSNITVQIDSQSDSNILNGIVELVENGFGE
ncbi:MAG: HPr family phosphocarrier protein [Desulfobacterales bacterium]|nr:HPr family phosphocarrier protein [Desulfobacterales bacterium]